MSRSIVKEGPAAQRFGRMVRLLRENLGFSQDAAAKWMTERGFEMSQVTWSRLENATRPTSLDEVFAVAEFLSVSHLDLVDAARSDALMLRADEARSQLRSAQLATSAAERALSLAREQENDALRRYALAALGAEHESADGA